MEPAETVVDAIRSALRETADPALAPGQQAYMKSEMPFLGVRVPAVRVLVRRLARGPAEPAEVRDTALVLWREAEFREERYAALALMALEPVRGRIDMIPVHEEMIRTGAWWDLVDEVAHRLAETLDAHPVGMSALLHAWTTDEDLWIRRASIIAQLSRGASVDRELLTAAIEANIDDAEFFIRKAIGWALRDHARTDPAWVRSFVAAHPALSPLSRREALKHLG
ncbi:DNA alkylation repair protein [Microbacterium capsulatum]|uniref:DNA alkylation repair protein n=1 Tax=Microbacterium capsulatum TaxID=3041921 RepID=A0ABU0XHG1_9MICO|nr:DNA alkylation repair protein [Microbacterium sp. ASV81]MDQ4214327.1 DNA alkylation repair protein [Microbacterium sp. ASV81]